MDLALNNLQRLICHKTKQTKPYIYEYWKVPYICNDNRMTVFIINFD